jgi:hypothetical protein
MRKLRKKWGNIKINGNIRKKRRTTNLANNLSFKNLLN